MKAKRWFIWFVLGLCSIPAISWAQKKKAVPYYEKGVEYVKEAKWLFASQQFDEAIKIDPNFANAYHERAKASYGMNLLMGAIEDLNQALTLQCTEKAEAYYLRGLCHEIREKPEYALEDYTQAIAHKPDVPLIYFQRALLYKKMDKKAEAIADLDKVIALDPKSDQAFGERGSIKLTLNDIEGACSDWQKAKEMGFDQMDVLIQLYCQK